LFTGSNYVTMTTNSSISLYTCIQKNYGWQLL